MIISFDKYSSYKRIYLQKYFLMKDSLQFLLQKVLGLKLYLFLFSIFIILKLKIDRKEKDFLIFNNIINQRGYILDIGANIGVMTTYLSKKHKESEVLAIEPMPVNFLTLKRISSLFKLHNCHLLNIALGDENGEAKMVMPVVKSVKKQGLSHVLHDSITKYNEGDICKVPLFKLDDLKELKKDTPIVAIKIDIENFEYFALKGGEHRINKDKPIIYAELWNNENREKCFELLKKLDYSVNIVHNKELEIFDPEKHTKQNFIFLPN